MKLRHQGIRLFSVVVVVALVAVWVRLSAQGQQVSLDKEAYLMPPKEIADVILSLRQERTLLTNISPDGKKFLVTKSDGPPTVQRMAQPCVYLGEMAFDPVACRARQLWVRSDAGYDLFFYADNRTVPVQVPSKARVSNPIWSPDGSKLAFYAHFEDATHIYIACAETGCSRRLTMTPVLATMVTSFQWSRDGKQIQTVLLPDDGKRETPKNHGAATEPKVRVALDGKNPSRTYRYLLESPHDMKLLEHLATGQLALIDVNDGKVTKVGFPNMIRTVSMAPGEKQFRISTMKKPFSYYVPAARFGSQECIWDLEGKSLYTLSDRKLQMTEPQPPAPTVVAGGQPTGKGFKKGKGGTQPAPAPTPTPTPTPTPPDPDPDPDAPPRAFQPVDPEGKRDLGWRPDGAGLSYLQLEPAKAKDDNAKDDKAKDDKARDKTQDEQFKGKGKGKDVQTKDDQVPRNDRVMLWMPPFGKDDVKVVYETPHRIATLQYSDDCRMLFLTQTVDNQRQIVAVDLADPKTTYVIHKGAAGGLGKAPNPAADKNDPPDDDPLTPTPLPEGEGPGGRDDEQQKKGGFGFGGGLPGAAQSLLTRSGRGEARVVRISSTGDVYLTGADRAPGAKTAGEQTAGGGGDPKRLPRPYIDKINIKFGKKIRIFEGKGEMTETIDAVDADDVKIVFTTRQMKDVVPDSYMHDLATGKVKKLTSNVDHNPWFHQLKVERFQVTRVDGFKFWVKVTTPPKHGGKLPAMFWIYPREYIDQAAYNAAAGRAAGVGGGGPAGAGLGNRFAAPAPRSMTLLTLLGYAVVEPDVPIVGPAGRMNDNYIPDLRNSLWAVIDDLDKKGIIDRDRLALGGHSYGAFSTANALAHTPFFKAGIAGDGNYNRTLTPMSFQTERRHLWDARETYLEMSPMLWANRIHGALLMYHGMEDANVGTNPINAEFLFMTLRGLGKPAALYMYPYEGHGPIALETTLDLWARWTAWLDMYVKNPQKAKKSSS